MREGSVQPELDSQLISDSQLYRYSRQIIIPEINEEGQELLLNSKVAIIGAGGLGCPVALYLGGAGVGEITIVDDDIIDVSNLNRQIAFKTNSVGGLKSENLKFSIQRNEGHCIFSYNIIYFHVLYAVKPRFTVPYAPLITGPNSSPTTRYMCKYIYIH